MFSTSTRRTNLLVTYQQGQPSVKGLCEKSSCLWMACWQEWRSHTRPFSREALFQLLGGSSMPTIITSFFTRIAFCYYRPITSYGALDLPTYFIDLTPFVPLLADGKPHNFSLGVESAEVDHAINQNWFVSALVQVRCVAKASTQARDDMDCRLSRTAAQGPQQGRSPSLRFNRLRRRRQPPLSARMETSTLPSAPRIRYTSSLRS